jgi:C-terminal processing protease CtpA/Prc
MGFTTSLVRRSSGAIFGGTMLRSRCSVVLTIVFALSDRPGLAAEQASADDARIDRIAGLCKVWGTVRYLHPYLAYKDIDWDAALIKSLPKVRAAKDTAEFAQSVQEMLNALGDPVTRVIRKHIMSNSGAGKSIKPPGKGASDQKDGKNDPTLFTWLEGDVLAVFPNAVTDYAKLIAWREQLRKEITKAQSVILDLRIPEASAFTFFGDLALSEIQDLLTVKEVQAPALRSLIHSGYRPQTGITSGGYYSAFVTQPLQVFAPAGDAKARKAVFLFNPDSTVPSVAVALQRAGDAFIVSQGRFPAESLYSAISVNLAMGITVSVRTSEMIAPEGMVAIAADREVPANADWNIKGSAFKAALELIQGPSKSRTLLKGATAAAAPVWRPDKTYDDMHHPDADYRLLALFRFWNVIHYFYPYKHLLDDDWDTILPRFIPILEAASDARAYELAIAELSTHVADGHTRVTGPELKTFFGEAPAPIRLRLVEKVPVISQLLDEAIAKEAGMQVGDVLVSVDGEPVEERMKRLGKYIASSTPEWHHVAILSRLLNGREGSTVKVGLRDGNNKMKEATLTRATKYFQLMQRKLASQVFRVLLDNIGYVDLEHLTTEQVDAMFEEFKDTKSIIFDLRNYPQGTAWAIAPRLNAKGARNGALYHRQLLDGFLQVDDDHLQDKGRVSFYQPLPKTDKWLYKGKTVTLIDERAISQSEFTGLFFEAACGTTFIGSPTAGANGDVTYFTLPGGLSVMFTGHDVCHADGRQLQRIGLVPHIEVRPTIEGIRENKDEVLERAIKFLKEGK